MIFDNRSTPLTEDEILRTEKYGISREQQLRTRKLMENNMLGPVESNAVNLEITK